MAEILVTGGTGFTGRHLVRNLVTEGLQVRVLTRSARHACRVLPPEVDLVEGDVADGKTVRGCVDGVSRIFHLAASFNEAGIPDGRYRRTHVAGTGLLLEAAKDEGVERFVHVSTVGVHSHVADPPADEEYRRRPGDIYQETKNEAELLALRFQRRHDFPLTVIRPTPIYGPGDLRLLKLFKMIDRGLFVMLGNGEVCFHMVHVADLVQGLRLADREPEAIGEVFIIGGPEYCSLNELTARIADLLGKPPPRFHLPVRPLYLLSAAVEKVCVPLRIEPPIYRRRVAFFTKNRAFSIEKAERVLGYRPRYDLDRGLRDTIAWYRSEGHLSRQRAQERPPRVPGRSVEVPGRGR